VRPFQVGGGLENTCERGCGCRCGPIPKRRCRLQSAIGERPSIVRRGRELEYFTIARNVAEGFVADRGWLAGSISLVGFGIDSFIEVTSGAALLWRMSVDADVQRRERNERGGIFHIPESGKDNPAREFAYPLCDGMGSTSTRNNHWRNRRNKLIMVQRNKLINVRQIKLN
jgi:hypothetical protein